MDDVRIVVQETVSQLGDSLGWFSENFLTS